MRNLAPLITFAFLILPVAYEEDMKVAAASSEGKQETVERLAVGDVVVCYGPGNGASMDSPYPLIIPRHANSSDNRGHLTVEDDHINGKPLITADAANACMLIQQSIGQVAQVIATAPLLNAFKQSVSLVFRIHLSESSKSGVLDNVQIAVEKTVRK